MSGGSTGRAFIEASRRFLTREYLPKIERALSHLGEDDLWWRPNEGSNAAGNLVLHLAGNVRQWVVHGLGGGDDDRRRADEFARRGGLSPDEVMAELRGALDEADAVLAELDPESLQAPREIQGLQVDGLQALYHVVEHFSMHTGQILYLAKLRSGRDLAFYAVDDRGRVVDTDW